MFKKVIVGIDGTSGGRDALALAGTLADAESRLLLVHAFPYESRPTRGSVEGFADLLRADAEGLLAEIAGGDPSLQARAVPDGSPARALHEVAEDEGADLIVVGSCHHRGAVGRLLLGDVTRSTLHGARCPVAIAPRDYRERPRPLRSIGVGYERTPQAEAALGTADALALATGASLLLHTEVTVPTPFSSAYAYNWTDFESDLRSIAERELAAAAEGLGVPATTEVSFRSAGDGLVRLSERVDLMVIGSRGWGAARRVLLGSTGDRLTHRAHCPVLLVPSPVAEAEDRARRAGHQALAA